MNVLKRFAKRCVALALCTCCLGGAVVANVPVTAQAAVSVSASTPVIRLDTASCELKATAQKYYLAVTVTPDRGTPPDAISSNPDVAVGKYVKKAGGRYLYEISGLKDGLATIYLRYANVENMMSVKVGDETGTINVRIPEGSTLRETAQALERAGVCSMKDVFDAANSNAFDSYSFIASIPNADSRYYKLEGYLYPDTYNFWKGQNVQSVLKTMLNNYQTKTANINWQNTAGLTKERVMTLASIVQRESTATDRANVASVFVNRLKSGNTVNVYRLQADSTMYYPYRAQGNVPSQLPGFQSTYNTYNITGLPAGPICSPSVESIQAALNPASTNYYYFCHSAAGNSYFAETLEQHNANLVAAGLRSAT